MKKSLLPVASLVQDLFTRRRSPLSEGYFLCQLTQFWEELAGEEIAKQAQPIRFKNNQLVLALPSSSHIQEMHFVKEVLREKINQRFPDKNVKSIYFQVKNAKPIDFKFLKKIDI